MFNRCTAYEFQSLAPKYVVSRFLRLNNKRDQILSLIVIGTNKSTIVACTEFRVHEKKKRQKLISHYAC